MRAVNRQMLVNRTILLLAATVALSGTDANGVAWSRYTAGATPGAVKIQAKVSSLPAVFFDVTVTP